MSNHSVYISHAWGGESEQIVQEIYKRCEKAGLNVILDRKDLGYRESISAFMKDLGRADAIILVVSNKYLHSEYCMYELLQTYENQNIISRIFPVVLDEVSISKSTERLDLVKYWENETENLETKIRELKNLSYIEGITDDLNLYQKIRNNIAKLTKILKDINTLNIKIHKENDYNQLLNSIQAYLKEVDAMGPSYEMARGGKPVNQNPNAAGSTDSDIQVNSVDSPESVQRKGWIAKIFRVWPLALLLVAVAALVYSWSGTSHKEMLSGKVPIPEGEGVREGNVENTTESMPDNQENQAKPQFTLSESEPDHLDPKTEKADPELVPSRPEAQEPRENSATSTSTVSPSQNPEFVSESPRNRNPVSEPEVYSGPSDVVDGNGENEKELISESKASPETGAAEEQQRIRTEKIFVLSQPISVRIPQNISSNTVTEGDIVYLENLAPVSAEGQMVADAGARVRTRIIDARPSHQGSRGSLGVRLEAIETIDGQWLDVSYHDIIDRKKEEIIFRAGTVFDRVELKSATLTLKVVQ